ncbi:hypothetical protein OIU79_004329 [Salix purpurea]|uniref:Uncharacterized protein n=1 Tax=Salix purpurea TaxID=77065 RepID=A0A9Q0UA08_SALPP|nr:hypothetical protein OIU79_004329 [Salix purpurea]
MLLENSAVPWSAPLILLNGLAFKKPEFTNLELPVLEFSFLLTRLVLELFGKKPSWLKRLEAEELLELL